MDSISANLSKFLHFLHLGIDGSYFCELRCIHPRTEEVRSYWFTIGDLHSRHFAMKSALELNQAGFGVYFTPSLRSCASRDFSNIVSLPVLWVDLDCDDDSKQRAAAWSRLMDFEIAPSVVCNSGGGFHAYYFLEPVALQDDEHRRELSFYLAGLSQLLGGDEAYAKSPASVMRLPVSVNTKEGRGAKKVSFEFFCPENRYAISDFDWLRLEAPKRSSSAWNGVGVAEAYLPERTRNYLQSGASQGNRNHELFAAACQLRDAGYSQSEAESLLVQRYVADALPGESSRQRETEAKGTIQSVYRQPRREPIVSRVSW
jgi:hypothetical protein